MNQITFGVNYFLQTFNDFDTGFSAASDGLLTGSSVAGAPAIKITGFDYTGATPPLGRTDVVGHVTEISPIPTAAISLNSVRSTDTPMWMSPTSAIRAGRFHSTVSAEPVPPTAPFRVP